MDYRIISPSQLSFFPIVHVYQEVMSGKRKFLPAGTWEKDENVIILVRYALEVCLSLSKEEIPRIHRAIIKQQKLWGALNRFKSIPKLIQFVYQGQYNEFDFHRVPAHYWDSLDNIRKRLEWYLQQEGIKIEQIPQYVNYDLLVKWGFSNPLKRYEHSPFRLIDALYPSVFKETDFKKIPQGYASDRDFLKRQFLTMLQKENIPIEEAPKKVTQRMLLKHRFSGSLKQHDGSPIKLMSYLFPNVFSVEQFHTKPNGYWKNVENVKAAIIQLVETNGINEEDIPTFITKKRLMQEGLGGMLSEYNGSPIEIIHAVFPGKYDVTQFKRVPNEYWHSQTNREQALRDFCKKRNITREQLPLLNRAYFRKHFPRFISLVDRYYDSKFYRWIMESFPEYTFTPEEFRLFVGVDGQICDSQEELAIHNFFVQNIDGEVEREGQRFTNHINGEVYIPDWIIYQQDRKWIIEYFGLYGSGRYKGYTEKSHRKMNFFQSLKDYGFIAIMPECFRGSGFCNIMSLLSKNGLYLRYNGNI